MTLAAAATLCVTSKLWAVMGEPEKERRSVYIFIKKNKKNYPPPRARITALSLLFCLFSLSAQSVSQWSVAYIDPTVYIYISRVNKINISNGNFLTQLFLFFFLAAEPRFDCAQAFFDVFGAFFV